SPSPNGITIAIAKIVAIDRRSPRKRNASTTRPEKMSRMPFVHIKGNAAGSWIGMPKAVEATTGLSKKLMPSGMIAAGITRVPQNSRELLFKMELSEPVFVFICLSFFRSLSGELQPVARSGPGSLEHSVGQDQSEKAYRRYEVREALVPF